MTEEKAPIPVITREWNGMPQVTKVDLGWLKLYYSYESIVAFETRHQGLVVSENCWGTTTGKHLNAIDNGQKEWRLPRAEFESNLRDALGIDEFSALEQEITKLQGELSKVADLTSREENVKIKEAANAEVAARIKISFHRAEIRRREVEEMRADMCRLALAVKAEILAGRIDPLTEVGFALHDFLTKHPCQPDPEGPEEEESE